MNCAGASLALWLLWTCASSSPNVTDEAYAARPQDRVRFPIAAAQRAFQRRSKFLAAQSKGGLKTFATIASSAPFIGFLGTVIGIEGSFAGPTGPALAPSFSLLPSSA
jgi:biopolymer transport protein ExbB/TolQ